MAGVILSARNEQRDRIKDCCLGNIEVHCSGCLAWTFGSRGMVGADHQIELSGRAAFLSAQWLEDNKAVFHHGESFPTPCDLV